MGDKPILQPSPGVCFVWLIVCLKSSDISWLRLRLLAFFLSLFRSLLCVPLLRNYVTACLMLTYVCRAINWVHPNLLVTMADNRFLGLHCPDISSCFVPKHFFTNTWPKMYLVTHDDLKSKLFRSEPDSWPSSLILFQGIDLFGGRCSIPKIMLLIIKPDVWLISVITNAINCNLTKNLFYCYN